MFSRSIHAAENGKISWFFKWFNNISLYIFICISIHTMTSLFIHSSVDTMLFPCLQFYKQCCYKYGGTDILSSWCFSFNPFWVGFFEWCMKGIQFQWFHVWLANHPSTINGRDFLFSIEYSWIPCQVLADHKDMLWFISGISILFHWSIFIAVHTLLITIAL